MELLKKTLLLREIIFRMSPYDLSTAPVNTEALIQRAEALDDDKLKEKEALTTQALE